jgi:hypothetical protein
MVVMAALWLTEALPIPVTSLLPIFMLPMLGVSTAKEVSSSYVTVGDTDGVDNHGDEDEMQITSM